MLLLGGGAALEAEAAEACSGAEVAGGGVGVDVTAAEPSLGFVGSGLSAGQCLRSVCRCSLLAVWARRCRSALGSCPGPGSFRRVAPGHACQPRWERPRRPAGPKEPGRVRSFLGSRAVRNSGVGWAGDGPLSPGLRGPAGPATPVPTL